MYPMMPMMGPMMPFGGVPTPPTVEQQRAAHEPGEGRAAQQREVEHGLAAPASQAGLHEDERDEGGRGHGERDHDRR